MSTTQYIGARYVPIFANPVEWSKTKTYEPLTIVTHEGNSYTSRQFVPVGIDIANEKYWALTGNYNAQIEQYRRETAQAVESSREYTDAAVKQVDEWLTDARDKYDVKSFAFDTVSDMQAGYKLLYVGAICHTNGFHASGDCGAAWYVITDTGTANGMDVIACGNLFANLIITDAFVAPEIFGAYGDDSHDDSAYIKAAISTHKVVKLSNKKYAIKTNIEIGNNVTITGSYSESCLVFYNTSFTATGTYLNSSYIKFSNMTFLSADLEHSDFIRNPTVPIFKIDRGMYWYFDTCNIYCTSNAMYIGSLYDSRFTNCNFYHLGDKNNAGIIFSSIDRAEPITHDGSNMICFYGNRFEYHEGLCIDILDSYNNKFWFVSNKFESSVNEYATAIKILGSNNIQMLNTFIAMSVNCVRSGIDLEGVVDFSIENTSIWWFKVNVEDFNEDIDAIRLDACLTGSVSLRNPQYNAPYTITKKRNGILLQRTSAATHTLDLKVNGEKINYIVGSSFIGIEKTDDGRYTMPEDGFMYICFKVTEDISTGYRLVSRYDWPKRIPLQKGQAFIDIIPMAKNESIILLNEDKISDVAIAYRSNGQNFYKV